MARALARARSAVTLVKELSVVSWRAMRANAASTASGAGSRRAEPACAISPADCAPSAAMPASGAEDIGRLGFVRQRELVHHPGEPERDLEVRADRRAPGLLDRKPQPPGG